MGVSKKSVPHRSFPVSSCAVYTALTHIPLAFFFLGAAAASTDGSLKVGLPPIARKDAATAPPSPPGRVHGAQRAGGADAARVDCNRCARRGRHERKRAGHNIAHNAPHTTMLPYRIDKAPMLLCRMKMHTLALVLQW